MTKVKNRDGNTYVYLVEGYRMAGKVHKRRLKAFGTLEKLEANEPGAFERLKREAKAGTLVEIPDKIITGSFDTNEKIGEDIQGYGWKILDDLFNGLEIPQFIKSHPASKSKADLTKILKLLTYQRILNPKSKLGTLQSQKQLFGDWNIDENAIYRSLSSLNKIKDDLQLYLHHQITQKVGREATLVFYDVTNYYFECDLNDPDQMDEQGKVQEKGFRHRGPSKEHRPNPIVQLGLFMDSNGIPICYRLFRGNLTDPVTYLPAIEQVKKQFGLERLIVVADKAMNSKHNVSETYKNGDGWLFSQKHRGKRGASKELQAYLLDPRDWQYNASLTFAQKSMIHTRLLNNGQKVQEKVLVTWDKHYADREQIRRDGAIDYAKQLTNAELFRQTAKKGGKKYLELSSLDPKTGELQPFAPFIHLDQEQIDFDAQFDGMNVFVTSECEMTDEAMLTYYHELSHIEDCFRITKSELQSRPVYVWKKEHIEGHFLTCYLSLVLIRLLEYFTHHELSAKRIVDALNSATCTKLVQGYYHVQASDDLKKIQKLLNMDWDKRYVKTEALNRYAKGWLSTIKK
jgi:transposase